MEVIDPEKGEVTEAPEHETVDGMMVPLNLARLDENELLDLFPSPIQASGALLMARKLLAEAPAVLHERSKALKAAKRDLVVAKGYARTRAAGRTDAERKVIADADPDVISAWEWVDTCELALEYAREMRKSLGEDIEVLRSLNANFREEHKR